MKRTIFEFPDDFLIELIKKALLKLTGEDVKDIIYPPGEQVSDEPSDEEE